MESFRRREQQRIKQKVQHDFIMAEAAARYTAKIVNGEGEQPRVWDYYPTLFSAEKAAFEHEKEVDDLETYKAKRAAYVQAFNARREEETQK